MSHPVVYVSEMLPFLSLIVRTEGAFRHVLSLPLGNRLPNMGLSSRVRWFFCSILPFAFLPLSLPLPLCLKMKQKRYLYKSL